MKVILPKNLPNVKFVLFYGRRWMPRLPYAIQILFNFDLAPPHSPSEISNYGDAAINVTHYPISYMLLYIVKF